VSDLTKLFQSGWTPKKAEQEAKRNLLDALTATKDVGLRGILGGFLGAPVDTANLVQNAGREAYNLFADKKVPLSQNPVGGSEWLGQKMQEAGLVSDKRRPMAELAAGFVSPDATDLMKLAAIPALARLQDAAVAAKLDPSQITVKNDVIYYPDEWINTLLGDVRGEVAAHNAEKMLGLPANATRLERAKAMGVDTPAYHGNVRFNRRDAREIEQFNPDAGGGARRGTGNWFSESPQNANTYAGSFNGGNVIPVLINTKKFGEIDVGGQNWQQITGDNVIRHGNETDTGVDELIDSNFEDYIDTNDLARYSRSQGDKGLRFFGANDRGGFVQGADNVPERADNLTVFDPSRIRSRFAAFDPAKKDSSNLLASLLAGTVVGKVATSDNKKKKDNKS
jgi:hypothetical protein